MKEEKLLYADETYAIRGAAFEVYKEMGNAFDENVYQECMEIAMKERGVEFEPQKKLPLKYKGKTLRHFYQPDLFCFGKIIVELLCCAQHKISYVGLENMLGSCFEPVKAA